MRSFFLLGTLPMAALAARTYPALLISRTYETGGGDEGYDGEHGPGYETGTGTCEDRGLQECGDGCIALDQICCPDELGGCPISDTCQLGENGQYGCCPEGKTCTGDGGASTTTITDVVIVTTTSTEPVPESTSTDEVVSTTDGYVVESTTTKASSTEATIATTSETSTQVTEPTVSETSTYTPEETSTTKAPSGTTEPTAVHSSTEASETEASTSVSATETATTKDITATITASSVSTTSKTATEDISTTTYIPTNSSTYSPGLGSTTTYGFSTSTIYATTTLTITSCAPTITKCPAGHGSTILITKTIAVSTTLCPITTTHGPYPVPTSSKAPGGGHGHGGDGNDGPGNGGHGGNGGNGGHGGHSGLSPVIKPTYACALGYSCAPGAPQLTKTRTFTPIGTGKPGYSGPVGTGKPGYTGTVGGQPSTTSRIPVTGGGAKVAGNFGVAVVVALLAFAL